MAQFVHLHVHTQYSILDGASDIGRLLKRGKALGMPAMAITDHGNMFGAKEFHDKAVKEGIKPILGCEVYVVKNRFERDKDEKAGDHLILLAKNMEGYHNLIRMVSYGWTEGFYYKPRIDKSLLRDYHEGIICCSACLGGEVPQAIMRNDIAGAEEIVREFREIFGEDYYLELQLHRSGVERIDRQVYENQLKVNRELLRIAAKYGIKYIASNDVHFILAEDAPAHDHLICLNTGHDLDDPNRMRYTFQEYLKSPEEMEALFPDNPEALATTLEIADKVEEYSLDHKPLMPNFPPPDDFRFAVEELRTSFARRYSIELEQKRGKDGIDPAVEERLTQTIAAIEACRGVEELEALASHEGDMQERLMIAKQYCYLRDLTYKGAAGRYGEPLEESVRERLEYELSTIEWMGFPGYFLIVWDFIRAAREMGVSVGPGRGSAAGSAVAYCLKITNIDPIKYDLLFERFLNPERISLPDVDVDFDKDGRGEVLNYVTEKYGKKRVAQIVTFGCMAPKLAIKDVARVEKLPLTESDRLTKLVPEKIAPAKGQSPFEYVYQESPDLAREKESPNPVIRNVLSYAEKLEGSVRQTGVHACGVIIGQDDLEKFAPLAVAKDKEAKNGSDTYKNVVQYEGKLVESVGLIKMDFLGLETLSIIKEALKNIREVHRIDIDIDSIPLDDAPTYELYSRGETTGLFQFESAGMKKYLRELQPNRFEDLIAMNALYRPGPMDYIPSFIRRKKGDEEITYDIADMEEYLYDTYGITVYQEQVMLLSQKLAGFTKGQADTLRKAMGKKQRETLDKMKPKFIDGAVAKGHDPKICEKIWTDWEAFASYAFNKSHATCYAYVAYQTGYLKAHYPSEFMAALLSRNLGDIKNITLYMQECKRMGIQVLGPDINHSFENFSSDSEGNVRFGLAAIKGVGSEAVRTIVEERREGGPFKDIYDFMERINTQKVNRKCIENMACAGAFDNITDFHRSKFFLWDRRDAGETPFVEQLMKYGNRVQLERQNAQQSLFGGGTVDIQKPVTPVCDEWGRFETLNREREVVGLYLSSHPLDEYAVAMKSICPTPLTELDNLQALAGREIRIVGMVVSSQDLRTSKDRPFGRFVLEDYNGSYEIALFDKDYEEFRKYLYPGYFLMVKGRVQPRRYARKGESEPGLEFKITGMMQLAEVSDKLLKEIVISIRLGDLTESLVNSLVARVGSSEGKMLLRVNVTDPETNVSVRFFARTKRVDVTREFLQFLEENELAYKII